MREITIKSLTKKIWKEAENQQYFLDFFQFQFAEKQNIRPYGEKPKCSCGEFGSLYYEDKEFFTLCDSCYNKTHVCTRCDSRTYRTRRTADNFNLCLDCYNMSLICHICNKTFLYGCHFNTNFYCRKCLETVAVICCECGEPVTREIARGEHNNYYCSSCYRERFSNWHPLQHTFDKGEKRRFKRRYGIEIETANGREHGEYLRDRTILGGAYDGSVDGANPLELYTPILSGDEGIECLKKIANTPLIVNKSCGMHIHLESEDYLNNWKKLKKLLYFCKKFEPQIFALVSKSRLDNRFCLPLMSTQSIQRIETTEDGFLSAFYNIEPHQIERFYRDNERGCHNTKIYNDGKYYMSVFNKGVGDKRYLWLNLNSHFYRNTIEIRLHQGTVNYEKIYNWVWLWQFVFNWIDHHSIDYITKINNLLGILPNALKDYYITRQTKLNKISIEQTPMAQEFTPYAHNVNAVHTEVDEAYREFRFCLAETQAEDDLPF